MICMEFRNKKNFLQQLYSLSKPGSPYQLKHGLVAVTKLNNLLQPLTIDLSTALALQFRVIRWTDVPH